MKLNEFYEVYKMYKYRDKITIPCDVPGCDKNETLNKDSAVRNIEQNGRFQCRSCCYTEEGRKRISDATSYKRSEETCKKMSEAKIAFFQTSKGKALKRRLSLLASQGHAENKFENAKRQGWYESQKAGKQFYGSSYELRLLVELDADDNVETFQTQVAYQWDGRGRCLDCLVIYKDRSKKAIEVKPVSRMNEQSNIDQVSDSYSYASKEGWDFELCTEDTFGMTERELRDWADEFRSHVGDFDWVAFRKEQNRKKAKKHYNQVIAKDLVEVQCEFCNEIHPVLRKSYNANIHRNGRYICEREGGHIAGSKPKKKKENPYAKEGEKKCCKCKKILLFENFNLDNSRADGYASRCKECKKK